MQPSEHDPTGTARQTPPGSPPYPEELRHELEAALRAKGPGYEPRTHNIEEDGGPRWVNRLIRETSPYLLQHAHNPVDWRPWSDEAFDEARRTDRPVLLSIGYSTCHWCHVMEVESFEDPEIASVINELYVPIKVDREQRPDVDSVYMSAVQMMTGHGGWPMTTVLTPDREPFFAGTYFPPRDGDRGAQMGFLSILHALSNVYRTERDRVVDQARLVSAEIRKRATPGPPSTLPGPDAITAAAEHLSRTFDRRWGGFGGAPKFPQPSLLELLLHAHRRTGDESALSMTLVTLRAMADGGIHDHVGGGFHRYSTDARWLVPHFEKMLYDNAQLASVYLAAHQLTRDPDLALVARDTLDYLVREMTSDDGGFYSATDADSVTAEGRVEEGWYFTWTPDELRTVLAPPEAEVLLRLSNAGPEGNFEGRTILHAARALRQVEEELGLSDHEARERVSAGLRALYAVRKLRPAPLTDTKIIAAWNGLAIGAFARGGLVLGEPRYVAVAERAAAFIEDRMVHDGLLARTYEPGGAPAPGVLDDHAFLAVGLLDLFEASGSARWLRFATALVETIEGRFRAENGAYHLTGTHGEELLAREVPFWDGAEPSGNAMAALALQRLWAFTGEDRYRQRVERVLAAFGDVLVSQPVGVARMLTVLDHVLDRPKEVAIVRPRAGGDVEPFRVVVAQTWLPGAAVVFTQEGDHLDELSVRIPWLAGKKTEGGKVTAYVCEMGECKAPTTEPAELARQLHELSRPGRPAAAD